MTGEELKKKLKETGVTQAEIARMLGTIPETIGQKFEAKDIKTGFLEDLCRVLGKDMSFFYSSAAPSEDKMMEEINKLRNDNLLLAKENSQLRKELRMKSDPNQPQRESEVYRLWVEYMKTEERRMNINNRMFELYQKEKEG